MQASGDGKSENPLVTMGNSLFSRGLPLYMLVLPVRFKGKSEYKILLLFFNENMSFSR